MSGLMRIWFDTEFIEDGKTIDLISIGLVAEDGRTFYGESTDCDLSRASPWVRGNVIPHLPGLDGDWSVQFFRKKLAEIVRAFAGDEPEFWAYYSSYDWVALCQLYGTMMDLPKGWPMWCRDLKQLAWSRGDLPLPEQTSTEHNALADAQWTRSAWEHVMGVAT